MAKGKKKTKLRERQVVMDFVPLPEGMESGGLVYFGGPHPDLADELGDSFVMTEQDWADFGEPQQITVTIRPGACISDGAA